MPSSHVEEIVYAGTEDGLLLEGVAMRPATGPVRPLGVVWVHGLTGKFYSTTIVRVGQALAARGFVFVAGNNRGHDFGAMVRKRDGAAELIGAGWERFSESPRDVATWIDYAMGQGVAGVALLGHSLGALKVCYYQAERQDSRVRGLVAASPPTRAGRANVELVAEAERMTAAGRGRDLLPWGSTGAGAGTLSAAAYLDRVRTNVDVYGFATPDPRVARVRCPILAMYGTEEPNVGTEADLQTIRRNATGSPRVETEMIPGADHSYGGHEEEVAALVAGWAEKLLA